MVIGILASFRAGVRFLGGPASASSYLGGARTARPVLPRWLVALERFIAADGPEFTGPKGPLAGENTPAGIGTCTRKSGHTQGMTVMPGAAAEASGPACRREGRLLRSGFALQKVGGGGYGLARGMMGLTGPARRRNRDRRRSPGAGRSGPVSSASWVPRRDRGMVSLAFAFVPCSFSRCIALVPRRGWTCRRSRRRIHLRPNDEKRLVCTHHSVKHIITIISCQSTLQEPAHCHTRLEGATPEI